MKIFALVDCNNFFVSCERAFNPALEKKPVLILSNNDGCIIARSNEVKALGIPMGAPFFEYKKICEQYRVKIFSVNPALYSDMSDRIMTLLAEHCPEMEVYSVDEAFLSFESKDEPILFQHLKEVRQSILRATGLPVSIGIASSKTLAKIATQLAKKQQGVFIFNSQQPSSWSSILNEFPIEEIWGIGRNLSIKLRALGIYSALQLRDYHASSLRKRFGVTIEKIILELRGLSCFDIEEISSKKSIMSSRSFNRPTKSLIDLKEAASYYAADACEKLREQKSLAHQVYVYLRTHPYIDGYRQGKSISFTQAINDTRIILDAVHCAVEELFTPEFRYRKAGVILINLIHEDAAQIDLLSTSSERETIKGQQLMYTLDHINQRLGKNTIYFAAQGIKRHWKMKSESRSPRYTTCWDELLTIKV